MQRVLLLYGGRSSEHAISCLSARSVLEVVDRDRYEVIAVGITRAGRWTLTEGVIATSAEQPLPQVDDAGATVALVGTRSGPQLLAIDEDTGTAHGLGGVDVAFPLLHGPFGEDGTVQGLFATVGLPYVGADVTASSIGIDKGAMKAAFAAQGLPQLPYRCITRAVWQHDRAGITAMLESELDAPWFVKPARQGSSIGISRVEAAEDLEEAMQLAFGYDEVAVIEQAADRPRELEVGVLGSSEPQVAGPGEVVPSHEFYDFEAKYLDASELRIPADVPEELAERLRHLAREAYRAIGCRGLGRVDFLLGADGQVVVNEINTIPGFTPASMFPRLWAAAGLDYPALVDRLLDDAAP
ncbi:MAG: D-alanine--D-alanine ligase family protein [Nitriliruptoraceae bacterium]